MIYHNNTPVTEVILHTSATPGGWANGMTVLDVVGEIDRWHKERGWKGIGYHRVIMPNGDIGVGRSIYDIGAHVRGHNTGSIGICLIPVRTVMQMGTFDDFYTRQQRESVKQYIKDLKVLTPISKVSGHNEYANKLCPGFNVVDNDWL